MSAWNLMQGIEWAALPFIIELLDVRDPLLLIHQLNAIRDGIKQ